MARAGRFRKKGKNRTKRTKRTKENASGQVGQAQPKTAADAPRSKSTTRRQKRRERTKAALSPECPTPESELPPIVGQPVEKGKKRSRSEAEECEGDHSEVPEPRPAKRVNIGSQVVGSGEWDFVREDTPGPEDPVLRAWAEEGKEADEVSSVGGKTALGDDTSRTPSVKARLSKEQLHSRLTAVWNGGLDPSTLGYSELLELFLEENWYVLQIEAKLMDAKKLVTGLHEANRELAVERSATQRKYREEIQWWAQKEGVLAKSVATRVESAKRRAKTKMERLRGLPFDHDTRRKLNAEVFCLLEEKSRLQHELFEKGERLKAAIQERDEREKQYRLALSRRKGASGALTRYEAVKAHSAKFYRLACEIKDILNRGKDSKEDIKEALRLFLQV